jgi:uncharacterized protein YjbI with pentapeptide repeats
MTRALLTRSNFDNGDFSGTTMMSAVATFGTFRFANFATMPGTFYRFPTDTNPSSAERTVSDSGEAFVWFVDFTGSDLTGADFTGVVLVGVNFTDAVLVGAVFDGARYDSSTIWPEGMAPPGAAITIEAPPATSPSATLAPTTTP